MPFPAGCHDRAPKVAVGAEHLAQRRREYLRTGKFLFNPPDHRLKTVDLGCKVLTARFRTFDAQAKLEVLLVADKNIGNPGYLAE